MLQNIFIRTILVQATSLNQPQILLEDAEIPALLKDVMYLDLRDGDIDLGVKNLLTSIRRHRIERLHTYDAVERGKE